MTVAAILPVILGAILSLSETTARLAPDDDERALLMDETRTGVYRMSRELRQATGNVSISAYAASFSIGATAITYDCSAPQPGVPGRSRCTRRAGSAPAAPVLGHVLNSANSTPVFARTGNYVEIRLQVAAAGDRKAGHDHTITLEDGAFMRNIP